MSAPGSPRNEEDLSIKSECCDSDLEQPQDGNDEDTYPEGSDWNVEQPQDGNDEENSCTDDEYSSEHDNSNINDEDDDFYPLIFIGNLEEAKQAGKERDKWLLVNVRGEEEFSSHTLNRDIWRDKVIAGIVKANFVFLQVYNDDTLGMKISYFYKIDSFPAILVIHPITGQKMDCWTGMIQPEDLMDKLAKFMDTTPQHDILKIINRRSESQAQEKENLGVEEEEEEEGEKSGQETHQEVLLDVYPPLPEEPTGDRSVCCSMAIKIPPDGRRIQRNFLLSDPIQLLWSFCFSELDEELKTKPFRLMIQGIAGARCSSKYLGYDTSVSFEESGLSNTIIVVTFE